MSQRLSYPLAVALAAGIVLQLAFAFAPDPGIGPGASGLPTLSPTVSDALDVFARNLVTVALIAIGGLVTGWTVLSRPTPYPRRRLAVYLVLLAVVYWAYFVSGVGWLATDLQLSRPALTLRLVHGYLEWPALLLPWAAVVFAVTPQRRLDLRLVAAACACSIALLSGAALLETFLVPDLLSTTA